MDIEIKEVQEIIKNLESGGELSIKEEKYLNVAKLCVQLAAERDAATLEYDYLNDQIEFWKNKSINITEQRNQLAADNVEAKKIISECREYFIAGVMNRIRPTNEGYLHMICDTFADETTSTDRIVAVVKDDGVEEFAESQKEYVRQHRNEMDQFLRAAYAGRSVDAERFAKQLREGKAND